MVVRCRTVVRVQAEAHPPVTSIATVTGALAHDEAWTMMPRALRWAAPGRDQNCPDSETPVIRGVVMGDQRSCT